MSSAMKSSGDFVLQMLQLGLEPTDSKGIRISFYKVLDPQL